LKVDFKKSFLRDVKRVRDASVKTWVRETIQSIEEAQVPQEIRDLKKLKQGERYYRIRIGDYRLGLILENDTFVFVRILHRKDLYRYFP